jgi:hypothetical protein
MHRALVRDLQQARALLVAQVAHELHRALELEAKGYEWVEAASGAAAGVGA